MSSRFSRIIRPKPKKITKPVVPLSEKCQVTLFLDLIHETLRTGSDAVSAIAAELLLRFQKPVIDVGYLVRIAADRKNPPKYRVRLLEIVGRIGVMADVGAHMDLFLLTSDKNAKVREAAARVIAALGPHQGNVPTVP